MFRDVCKPLAFPLVMSAVVLGSPLPVLADDDDDKRRRLSAVPFVFVGTAAQCGGTAGSNIVTSAWLGGMGLPDNGGPNTTFLTIGAPPVLVEPLVLVPANQRDPHRGLLISKNGPTPDCSSAGAQIRGVKGIIVDLDFALGFDYRNGSHCGGGAPRFNVSYTTPTGSDGFSFVGGCGNDSTPTFAPQDPLQWSRVRFETSNAGESFPVIPVGSRIESITLILDEGTDTPTLARPSGDLGNPAGIGLAVVDNIFIDGRFIRSGNGIEPEPRREGRGHDDD